MNKQTPVEFLKECISIHLTFDQQMQFEGLFQTAQNLEMQQHGETWKAAIDAGEKRGWYFVRAHDDFESYYKRKYTSND